jgi:DNA-binding MarR family transcriptional regulator
MSGNVSRALQQKRRFATCEQEVVLGIRVLAARILEPWEKFLKSHGDLSNSQYNLLRILRGSHPVRLASSDVGDRMIARDPDITRLVDRLVKRGLVDRQRSESDRRVVEIGITKTGLALLKTLDPHVDRLPTALVGRLGHPKLKELTALLDELLEKFGTYP